jgi:hypothetical protein
VHVALIDPSRVVLKIVAGMLEAGGHTPAAPQCAGAASSLAGCIQLAISPGTASSAISA